MMTDIEQTSHITDPLSNPDGAAALLDAATADPNASLSVDGSALVASNLTATSVSGGSGVTATYAAVSDATLEWIAAFTSASMSYAATLDPSDNARRYLLGTPRTVDQMEQWTKTWGTANGHDFGTYQVSATFGRYGELPLIVVAVGLSNAPENFFMLVDGINGNVDGPFVSGGKLHPSQLLALHSDEYQSGSAWAVVRTDTGCGVDFADTRSPYLPAPPAGTVPPGWVPVTGPPPGKPTSWTCVSTPSGGCSCTATYNYTTAPGTACPVLVPPMSSPGLCILKLDVTCTTPAGGGGAACNGTGAGAPVAPTTPPSGSPPGSPLPSPRPPATGVPGAPGTTGCSDTWWYWS